MTKRSVSYLCLSFSMCVIVGLQLANHFMMFREPKNVCICDGIYKTSADQKRILVDNDSPAKGLTFDRHVEGLLSLLGQMDTVEQAELGLGTDTLNKLLNEIKHFRKGIKNTKQSEQSEPDEVVNGPEIQEICPERFLGKSLTYGYPFFRKGFATVNCTQYVPLKELVTVVIDDVYTSPSNPPVYERVLKGLAKEIPDINVVYITRNKPGGQLENLKSKVKVLLVDKTAKQGKMWSDSLKHVNTKYVLISPSLDNFDDDINLKRLVRILSHNTDLAIASGAYRTRSGQWDIGCQQAIIRNYTLTLQGGYYLSFSECVVCDYSPGPWLARTHELKELKFDESLHFGAFHDIFFKVKKQKRLAVSCPDVMFNIDKPQREDDDVEYMTFANKYDLKKIVEPDGRVRWYGCRRDIKHRQGRSCSRQRGLAVPPCDLENLADAIKLVMRECEKAGLFCELQEGTLLGAVKFSKVLPWERDADLTFLTANYTAFKELEPVFRAAGYSLTSHDSSLWCCADNRKAGGKFTMSADGWTIELYGQHLMESEMLVAGGKSPTKVDFAGQMVTVMRNPGLFARNRYGKNLYKHQEHWLDRGKTSGWHFYNPGKFEGCPAKDHSACLNQYSIDGNMQFDNNICPCTLSSPEPR